MYGGGNEVKEWCFAHPKAYYVTPIIAIKNKLRAIEKMKVNVASFDTPSLLNSLPIKEFPTSEELYQHQIEYRNYE